MPKLNALIAKNAGPGKHLDGDGLLLAVTKSGSKNWVYRFQLNKRSREMGLGPYPEVSLAQAREKASDARRQVKRGDDPIDARKVVEQRIPTFAGAAASYIRAHRNAWVRKWTRMQVSLLRRYTGPIRRIPVDEIRVEDALRVLTPIWTKIPPTADVVRLRCEAVLDASTAMGHRQGPNPFSWRGNLKHLLPKVADLHRIEHHPAIDYRDMPAFLAELPDTIAAKALQFVALTATRAAEVRFMTWEEIDGDVWTIPAGRTKQRRELRIPLSALALKILETMPRVGPFVFPGQRYDKALGHVAMLRALQRLRPGVTVHGLRSTFRDWCEETTSYPRIVAEMALGHQVGSEVERAYRRTDLFDRRRELMEAWGSYCSIEPDEKVVSIRRTA